MSYDTDKVLAEARAVAQVLLSEGPQKASQPACYIVAMLYGAAALFIASRADGVNYDEVAESLHEGINLVMEDLKPAGRMLNL